MTYRSFCQPNELMDLLVERFKIPDPDGVENKKDPISMKAMKTFKTTYVTPIQLRYVRQIERRGSWLVVRMLKRILRSSQHLACHAAGSKAT